MSNNSFSKVGIDFAILNFFKKQMLIIKFKIFQLKIESILVSSYISYQLLVCEKRYLIRSEI